jgi:hypothetical protein
MSETAAQYKKLPCRICGRLLPKDYRGSVCRVCMGFEDAPNLVCPDFGEIFESWRNGRFLVVARCKNCLTSKRIKTVKAVWAKNGGKKPGGRHKEPKHNQVQSEETKDVQYVWSVTPGIMELTNLTTLELDFTAAPEVLAWLQSHHDDIPGHIMGLIMLEIPTDVCKRWVLDRLRK